MKELEKAIAALKNTRDYENLESILGKELGKALTKVIELAEETLNEREVLDIKDSQKFWEKNIIREGGPFQHLMLRGNFDKEDHDQLVTLEAKIELLQSLIELYGFIKDLPPWTANALQEKKLILEKDLDQLKIKLEI